MVTSSAAAAPLFSSLAKGTLIGDPVDTYTALSPKINGQVRSLVCGKPGYDTTCVGRVQQRRNIHIYKKGYRRVCEKFLENSVNPQKFLFFGIVVVSG